MNLPNFDLNLDQKKTECKVRFPRVLPLGEVDTGDSAGLLRSQNLPCSLMCFFVRFVSLGENPNRQDKRTHLLSRVVK